MNKEKVKIVIGIENCKQCPFFEEKRMYTEDSFEEAHDWHCKKADGRKIQGYVEWYEEKKIPVPDWCPSRLSNI